MARVMPICPLCGARGLCPDPTLHERFDALLALHTKLANDLVCPDPRLHQSEPEEVEPNPWLDFAALRDAGWKR